MDHPLDNPVWAALTGPHAELAIGHGEARHYPRDIAPFSAISEPSAAAYADLARDLDPGLEARLFRPTAEAPPPGWEILSARPILQMIATDPRGLRDDAALEGGTGHLTLGPDDIGDMCDLAAATKPGPFGPRTPLLGTYVGVRRGGRLAAMAGERFRLPGHAEISAVCTHPEARRRGLAAALTRHLARQIFARGEVPFLHVFADNRPALALYERLGFRTRAQLFVLWHRPGRGGDRA